MRIIGKKYYRPTSVNLLPQEIQITFKFFSPTEGMKGYVVQIHHVDGPWTAKINSVPVVFEGDEGERAEFFARDMARVVERWAKAKDGR